MITGVVETVLKRYLGDYLEGINAESLSLSIFQGEINLSNVKIKPAATELLNLPLRLINGSVGLLKVNINWRSFKIFIELDDFSILVGPKLMEEWSEQNEKERLVNSRDRALDTTDLQCEMKLGMSDDQSSGMYSKLVGRVSDTIEIIINRVHIRYEDPAMEFYGGVLLQSLRIQGTNANWEPDSVPDDNSKKMHKKLDLEYLAVYWQAEAADSNFGRPHAEMAWSSQQHHDMSYVLYPVSGSLNLTQNADLSDRQTPRYHIQGSLQSLTTQFSFGQYSTFRYFFGFLGEFSEFQQVTQARIEKYYPHRPNCSIVGNAKEWWRYALRCVKISMVTEGVIEEKQEKGWDYLFQPETLMRLRQRKKYTELLTKSKQKPHEMTEEEKLDLADLKELIAFPDLVRWHAMIMDRVLKVQQKEKLEKQAQEPQKQSWYGYLTGTDDSKQATDALLQAIETLDKVDDVTDEQWWSSLSDTSGPFLKLNFEVLRVSMEFKIGDTVIDKGRLDHMAFGLQSDRDGRTRATFALGDLVLESDRKSANGTLKKHELIKKADDAILTKRSSKERSEQVIFHDPDEQIDRLFRLEYLSGTEKENPSVKFVGSKMILHLQRHLFAELIAFLSSSESELTRPDVPDRRLDPETGKRKRFSYFLHKYQGNQGIEIYKLAERRFDPGDHQPYNIIRFIEKYGEQEGRRVWAEAEWRTGRRDGIIRTRRQFELDFGVEAEEAWESAERRIDLADYRVKTLTNFKEWYGNEEGRVRWDSAVPAGSQAPSGMWYKKIVHFQQAERSRMRELFQQTTLSIHVSLDAPIIVLPTTFHDGPVLVLHTGHLKVKSEHLDAQQLATFHESVTKVDIMTITLSNIELEHYTSLFHFSQFAMSGTAARQSPPFKMVKNFDINLQMRSTERDNLPNRTDIEGDIPALHIFFDVACYGAFFQAIRTYSAGGLVMQEHNNNYQQEVEQQAGAESSLEKTMKTASGLDLSTDYAGTHLSLEMPDLRIRFLFEPRSPEDGKQAGGRCVELSTHNMAYRQYNHDDYLQLNLTLKELQATQPNVPDGTADKILINTNTVGDSAEHFVMVNILMTDVASVRATRDFESDTYVDLEFGAVHWLCSPAPMRALVKCLKTTPPNQYLHLMQDREELDQSLNQTLRGSMDLPQGRTDMPTDIPKRSQTIANYQINFKLEALSMTCFDEKRNQSFGKWTVTSSQFALSLYESGTEFDGQFGNFRITDLSNKLTPQILGVKEGAEYLLRITIRTYSPDFPEDYPDYNMYISFKLVTIQLCLLLQKVTRMWSWIFDGFVPSITAGPTPEEQRQIEKDYSDTGQGTTPESTGSWPGLTPGREEEVGPVLSFSTNQKPPHFTLGPYEENLTSPAKPAPNASQDSDDFLSASGGSPRASLDDIPDTIVSPMQVENESPVQKRTIPYDADGRPSFVFSPVPRRGSTGLANDNNVSPGSVIRQSTDLETVASGMIPDTMANVYKYKLDVDINEPTILVPSGPQRSAEHIKLVVGSFRITNRYEEPYEDYMHHRNIIVFDCRNVHIITDSGYKLLDRVDITADLHQCIEQGLDPHPPFQLICKISRIPFVFTSPILGVVIKVFNENILTQDPDISPLLEEVVDEVLDEAIEEVGDASPSAGSDSRDGSPGGQDAPPPAKWGRYQFILDGAQFRLERSITHDFLTSSAFESDGESKMLAELNADHIEIDIDKWYVGKTQIDVRLAAARLRSGSLPDPFDQFLARQNDKRSAGSQYHRGSTIEENIATSIKMERPAPDKGYELRVQYTVEPERVQTKIVVDQPRIVFVWPVVNDIVQFFKSAYASSLPPGGTPPLDPTFIDQPSSDPPPQQLGDRRQSFASTDSGGTEARQTVETILIINLGRSRFILPEKLSDPNSRLLVFDGTAYFKRQLTYHERKWMFSLLELEMIYIKNWETLEKIEASDRKDYTDVDIRCITRNGNVLLSIDKKIKENVPTSNRISFKDVEKNVVHLNVEPVNLTMGQTDVRAVVGCIDAQTLLPEGAARAFGLRDQDDDPRRSRSIDGTNSPKGTGGSFTQPEVRGAGALDGRELDTQVMGAQRTDEEDFLTENTPPDDRSSSSGPSLVHAGSVHSLVPSKDSDAVMSVPSQLSHRSTIGNINDIGSPTDGPMFDQYASGSYKGQRNTSEERDKVKPLVRAKKLEIFDDYEFVFHEFRVCLVFDLHHGVACIPFLEFRLLDLKTNYSAETCLYQNKKSDVRYVATADVQVSTKYFNPASVGWEPLIEGCSKLAEGREAHEMFNFRVKRACEPNTGKDTHRSHMLRDLQNQSVRNVKAAMPSSPDEYLAKKHKEFDRWNIDSSEGLILNVSPVFLKSCVLNYWSWFEDRKKLSQMSSSSTNYVKKASGTRAESQFTPYCVKNETGMKIRIRTVIISHTGDALSQEFAEDSPITLNNGEDVRLWNVKVDLKSEQTTIVAVEVTIVPDGGFKGSEKNILPDVRRVIVNKSGVYTYPLAKHDQSGAQMLQQARLQHHRSASSAEQFMMLPDREDHLIGRVVVDEASKMLVLQSPVILRNNFETPMRVQLIGSDACNEFSAILYEGQNVALPITGCQKGTLLCTPLLHYSNRKPTSAPTTGASPSNAPAVPPPPPPPESKQYTSEPVELQDLHKINKMKSVHCTNGQGEDFWFVVVVRREMIKYRSNETAQTTIHLCAPVTIRSLLPLQSVFELQCFKEEEEEGWDSSSKTSRSSIISRVSSKLSKSKLPLNASDFGTVHTNTKQDCHKISVEADIKLRLCLYATQWSENKVVWSHRKLKKDSNKDVKAPKDAKIHVPDEKGNTTKLKIVYSNKPGFPPDITLYAPFWLVNYATKLKGIQFSYPAQVHPFGQARMVAQSQLPSPDSDSAMVTPLDCDAQNLIICINAFTSEYFPIGVVGFAGEVVVTESSLMTGGKKSYVFGASVSTYNVASSLPVQLVNIFPRYMVVNATSVNLKLRQHTLGNKADEFMLKVNDQIPMWWEDSTRELALQVKVDQADWYWSGQLPTSPLGSYEAQLCHSTKPFILNLIVEVRLVRQSSLFVIIRQSSKRVPGIRIRNFSKAIVKYRQLDAEVSQNGIKKGMSFFSLAPDTEIDFAWLEPTLPHKLQLKVGSDVSRTEVDFSKGESDGYLDVSSIGHVDRIRFRMRYSGPTKVLTVFDEKSGIVSRYSAFDLPRAAPWRTIKIRFGGLGLSLIGQTDVDFTGMWSVLSATDITKNKKPATEIMFVMVDHISATLQFSKTHQTFDFKLNDIQIDNLRDDAWFPVVLRRAGAKRGVEGWASGQKQDKLASSSSAAVGSASAPPPPPPPILQVMFDERLNVAGKRVRYVEKLKIFLQEIDVKLDAQFVSDIMSFCTDAYIEVKRMMSNLQTSFVPTPLEIDIKEGLLRIHVNDFSVQPIACNLSWNPGYVGGDAPTLGSGFLASFSAVNESPLKFQLMQLSRVSNSKAGLQSEVVEFYKRQAMMQVSTLLGSAAVFGNPAGLMKGVFTGVGDAFYEPMAGAMQSPEAAFDGFVRGGQSLSKNTVGSMFESFANVTGALSTGMGHLSMDEQYQKDKAKRQKDRPGDLQSGLYRGGESLMRGFGEGISGLVTQPLAGAEKKGAQGFFEGGMKGLAGLITKPAAGVFDLMSETAEGVKNNAKKDDSKQIRVRRALYGADHVIRAYSPQDAQVMQVLSSIDIRAQSSSPSYMTPELKEAGALTDLGLEQYVWDNGRPSGTVITNEYVINFERKPTGWEIRFAVPIWQIQDINAETQRGVATLVFKPEFNRGRKIVVEASSPAVLIQIVDAIRHQIHINTLLFDN